MCLDYGTPYRLRMARLGLCDYPLECHDKATLLAHLREEMEAGHYGDPALFHPFLKVLLQGLVENHGRIFWLWQEPRHAFCDVIQALGIMFGFINGRDCVPAAVEQERFMRCRMDWVHPQVFMVARNVAQACCDPEDIAPWRELPETWLGFAGIDGLLLDTAMRNPELMQLSVA